MTPSRVAWRLFGWSSLGIVMVSVVMYRTFSPVFILWSLPVIVINGLMSIIYYLLMVPMWTRVGPTRAVQIPAAVLAIGTLIWLNLSYRSDYDRGRYWSGGVQMSVLVIALPFLITVWTSCREIRRQDADSEPSEGRAARYDGKPLSQ